MRQIAKDIIKVVTDNCTITGPILEVGSLQWNDQVGFADLRPLFPGFEYIGIDIEDGPGVDRVMNAYDMSYFTDYVGCVVCVDTLEHIEYPRRLVDQVYRVLKTDGIFILITVFNWDIHYHPDDFWRFTPSALRSLCDELFHAKVVGQIGETLLPKTVWAVAKKGWYGLLEGQRLCNNILKLKEY